MIQGLSVKVHASLDQITAVVAPSPPLNHAGCSCVVIHPEQPTYCGCGGLDATLIAPIYNYLWRPRHPRTSQYICVSLAANGQITSFVAASPRMSRVAVVVASSPPICFKYWFYADAASMPQWSVRRMRPGKSL